MVYLGVNLTILLRVWQRVHLKVTPNYALSNLHKDEQEGAFEFELKGALEVSLELHLWSYLFVHLLIQKVSQNNSSKSGPDDPLEGAFDGELDIALKDAR